MPWFRQSSFGMSLARLRLPKQHTIATSDEADESARQPPATVVTGVDPPLNKSIVRERGRGITNLQNFRSVLRTAEGRSISQINSPLEQLFCVM